MCHADQLLSSLHFSVSTPGCSWYRGKLLYSLIYQVNKGSCTTTGTYSTVQPPRSKIIHDFSTSRWEKWSPKKIQDTSEFKRLKGYQYIQYIYVVIYLYAIFLFHFIIRITPSLPTKTDTLRAPTYRPWSARPFLCSARRRIRRCRPRTRSASLRRGYMQAMVAGLDICPR